jgi:CHAT domain-containing protein/Tfp pilus assembly protein PilF
MGAALLVLVLLGCAASDAGAAAPPARPRPLSKEERRRKEQEVTALYLRAIRLCLEGRYKEALAPLDRSVAMFNKLMPTMKLPRGELGLARVLMNLGKMLKERGEFTRAERLLRAALATYRKLYPEARFPDGHANLADGLNAMGLYFEARGQLGKAESYYRQSLKMRRKVFRKTRFPDGHTELALGLSNLGIILRAQGKYDEAGPLLRQALAMRRTLFPSARFPRGHGDLAIGLNQLGRLLEAEGDYARAEPLQREALVMLRKLYPPEKFPTGHRDLAHGLNNLAAVLTGRGRYGQAEPLMREALAMMRKLYSPALFPKGHPDLATQINNLGAVLSSRGDYARAEVLVREALAMRRKLYPEAKFSGGHPELANSHVNLGAVLRAQGKHAQAEKAMRAGLHAFRKLYPKERYPAGHLDLATTLNNLAAVLQEQRKYDQAEPFLRSALAMMGDLHSRKKFPAGHPNLAGMQCNLAVVLEQRGDYPAAEKQARAAVGMFRKLYPRAQLPDGHPHLAHALFNLGLLLGARGKRADAVQTFAEALAMYQRLAETFADTGAEAEALNYLATLPAPGEVFLSVTAKRSKEAPEHYRLLWQSKATLTRTLGRRQRLLRAARDRPTRNKVAQLLDVRRRLARLVLAPSAGEDKTRRKRLEALTERKEELEKVLARKLPELARERMRRLAPHTDLARKLPARTAFVDLFRYRTSDFKKRNWGEARYTAFVLNKGQAVRRVELGAAADVEKALATWRRDIARGHRGVAARTLRRLLWEPLAKHLAAGVEAVYLCPDGQLSALPWAALPGSKPGTVLLEEHAIALVPHGPLLLEQLSHPPASGGAGTLLALGGVQYDRAPDPVKRSTEVASLAPAERSAGAKWDDLPGTVRELRQVVAQASRGRQPPEVIERRGRAAETVRLLLDLPRARWAHLATHGFFAAPASDVRRHLFDRRDFLLGIGGERRGAAARNPLTQSGLVLAGANRPRKDPDADGGILTAEAIAGLSLDGLELAVLSACETGLGEAAAGEGVFGLQRAFHLAGCRAVVASLWKVDDQATAALMSLFYHHLWVKGQKPLEALRNAQLALYRHPSEVSALAKGRGPDFDKVVKRVTRPPAKRRKGPGPVKHWAAFVLSGAGR